MDSETPEITSRNLPSESIIAQVMKNEELASLRNNILDSESTSLVNTSQKNFGFQYSVHAGKFTEVFEEIIQDERVPFGLRKFRKPRWFYKTPFGEPRGIDIIKIRTLAKSWAFQSCMTTQIQKIRSIESAYVPKDKDKMKDPIMRAKIKEIEAKAEYVNANGQSLKDVYLEALIDAFEIDAFCIAKSFYGDVIEWIDLVDDAGFDPSEFATDPASQTQWYVPIDAPKGYMGEVSAIDGGSILKQFDHTNFILGFWEHSYGKGVPKFFSKREIAYMPMNKAPYDSYGWSYAQQLEDVLKAIIAAVMNTTKFSERGNIAPGLLALEGMDKDGYDEFRDYWVNQLMGQPHRFGTVRVPADGSIKWIPLNFTAQDITFLDGTDFYWRIVMAVTHTTPSAMGITDTVNKSTSEEQAKVQERISQAPLLDLVQDFINRHWLFELGVGEEIEHIWKPTVDLDTENKREDVRTKQLANWRRTINEIRKEDGEDPVWWGNVPKEMLMAFIQPNQIPGDFVTDPSNINLPQALTDIIRQMDPDSELTPAGAENVLDDNIAVITQQIEELQSPEEELDSMQATTENVLNALDLIRGLIEDRSKASDQKIRDTINSIVQLIETLDVEGYGEVLLHLGLVKELTNDNSNNSSQQIKDIVTSLVQTVQEINILLENEYYLKYKSFENKTEIKVTKDNISINMIEYNIPKKKTLKALSDSEEELISRRIDNFIKDPINDISETMVDLLEDWKEALLVMVQGRLKEGVDITQAIVDAVIMITSPDSQLVLQMTNQLSAELEAVFLSALKLNNNMTEGELPPIFSGEADQEIRFLRNNALLVADKIASDLEGQLRRALIEGLSRGESIPDLAKRVQGVFDATPARAETVARTETIRAMVEGRYFSMEKAGATQWEFFAHLDDRVDSECRQLHGKIFDIDDREFIPPIHPNCRCTILAIIPDEEDID